MPSPLLTIGTFARAVNLSPSALRHYDECGLLRPADVDDLTGYRYYTPALAARAEMISVMRDAGFSIEQMRTVLDGDRESRESVLRGFAEDAARRSARIDSLVGELLQGDRAGVDRVASHVAVRGPELASALRQVRPAADQDATCPLSAVVIDAVEGSLDVAATNRYWMSVRELPRVAPGDPGRVVLSLDHSSAVAAALDALDQATLVLSEDGVTVDGRCYPGRPDAFPAHRLVIDGLEQATTRAVIAREQLLAAVESVGRAEVVLTLRPGRCTVTPHTATDTATDTAGVGVDATLEGAALAVRLGSALLLRAAGSTVGAEIEIAATGAERPVRLSSPYQPGYVALLMPTSPRP